MTYMGFLGNCSIKGKPQDMDFLVLCVHQLRVNIRHVSLLCGRGPVEQGSGVSKLPQKKLAIGSLLGWSWAFCSVLQLRATIRYMGYGPPP